ncbi:hypothetical protein ANCDUO_05793 [Ancylostoma duodenale]|uniref:Uncharacterized protein n=1 Tax=Ancylostoma duodenale TaxID=51022 RepID=A0A0C2H3B5_9BILA|nr:hypothetical protein ANCDUO_05793 [Ancylostoma duodenale]
MQQPALLLLLLLLCSSVTACYRYAKGQKSPCEDLRCGPGEDCIVSQPKELSVIFCVIIDPHES